MKLLAYALLWGLAVVLPSAASAQTAPGGAAERDKALTVAPQAVPAAGAQASPAENRGTAAGPANICRELVAFVEKQAAAPPPAGAGQPGPPAAGSAAGASVQGSGQAAPVPQAPAAAGPSADDLAKASAMAGADNLQGCQQAVRKMRLAGVNLPPPLLALAALKPEMIGRGKP